MMAALLRWLGNLLGQRPQLDSLPEMPTTVRMFVEGRSARHVAYELHQTELAHLIWPEAVKQVSDDIREYLLELIDVIEELERQRDQAEAEAAELAGQVNR